MLLSKNSAITTTIALSILLQMLLGSSLQAQVFPQPCETPESNGTGCFCETAGILCTPDQLDGFEFSMSNVENFGGLGDGVGGFPDDLCPGDSQGGVPNNVNFFAFIVWCETLSFNVVVSNCEDNPLDGFETYGIQMALFANCPAANGGDWEPVQCITTGSDACFDTEALVPTLQSFTASGLEIGATYYFMVDGCALSTCKVLIDVQGVCGNGEITDWTNGLFGEQNVCVGDTETYTAEDNLVGLDGAEEYYYYLDGVLIEEGEEQYEIDITWDTPGTYELCVDVSNLPCIPVTDTPAQNCITINVLGPGGGDIVANPQNLCPDQTSTITVNNANTDPQLTQYIIIIGPDGTVVQVVNGLTTDLTYDQCGTFTAYYYNFLTADMPTLPNVGDIWTLPDCTTSCCDLNDVMITFEDNEDPTFTSTPSDITVDCVEDVAPDEELVWTDNCAGTGMVPPVVVENFTLCDGGTITRTWSFTDSCANNVEYTQNIVLDAIPLAEFTMMPMDITIDCDEAQTFMPVDLDYTNSASGVCEISGSVSPTSVGTFDLCGSTVTYTWEFTDQCGRDIMHSQSVTVEEVGSANEFIDPPADITITCEEWQTFTPEILGYSNGLNGVCEISGSVMATTSDVHDPCGNSITFNWEFTDACGREITHSQVVTVEQAIQAAFISPPGNISIDCNALQMFTPETLTYTNLGIGTCLIEGTVDATADGMLDTCGNSVTYTWEFIDDCGRLLTYSQIVTVEPIAPAVFIDPPEDITIDCDELQIFSPATLTYSNGGSGNCLIEGTVDAMAAGTLEICGSTVTYTWDFTDECGRNISHSQMVTVEPIPIASFANPPVNTTINCDQLQSFTPEVLTYTNGGTGNCLIQGTVDPVANGTLDECGSTVTYTWEFIDQCSRLISHSQTVTVEPIPEAMYVDPPPDVTINCDQLQTFAPGMLMYTNGGIGDCLIEGTVDPASNGTLDECGSTVTYTWEFTDQCSRLISHSQTVTVEPIPEAMYVDPPPDVTINCDQLQTFAPAMLMYTNGGIGYCLIEGTVDPASNGVLDECGSTVTYTWEFTDQCSRLISHSQTVTVEPIPEADFVNPPPDITINCDQLQTFTPPTLTYTNGGTGDCLIEGTVDPAIDGMLDECGSTVTYTWEFTDQCARTISHSQTVTVEPIPEATYVDPPANETLTCDDLQSFMPLDLMYSNGGTGDCLIEGMVSPVADGMLDECGSTVMFTWEFTDQCGRLISHTQTVTVEPIDEAAFVDPPGDIDLTCDELQSFSPATLSYTNGGTGGCLIEGSVDPEASGTLDICGGSVTYTWEYTDDCNRTISHTQIVNVIPIDPPSFIDPPMDMNVMCPDKPNEGELVALLYTNGGTDGCEIAGEVIPTEAYNVTECGGEIAYTWEFTDDCNVTISHTQTITVDPAPQAQLENLPPSSITIECSENTDMGPELVVTNNLIGDCLIEETISPTKVGDAGICGGAFEFVWEFTDDCGRLTNFTQTVNVNPAPAAIFDNIPADIDIDCSENANNPEDLSYSNGEGGSCEISGQVAGVRSGSIDYCGGILVDTWEFTDECGITISTSRNVNVAPAPPAEFINPPADITVDCDNVNTVPSLLSYNNGESGLCTIAGSAIAVVSGSFDACGGGLIYTWSFVDDCGRAISHSQNISIDPAPDPAFINPPADQIIGCEETYTGPVALNYTNSSGGICEISGVIVPTTSQVDNVITNVWELIHPCTGELITHTQVVTLSIEPDININPANVFLCLGDSYDLAETIVDETNGTTITVTYHNAFPPTPANEISSVVSPAMDFIYVINAVNEFGCEDSELINVFVEEPPFAGTDQMTTVCSDGIPLNLFNFIIPTADFTGSWLDLDGIGANISNPNAVTFNNVLPGNYSLYYVVVSNTVCENDTMVLDIEVIDDVSFEVTEVTCIGSNDFYEVYINSNGFEIQSTEGDLINIMGDEYVITNIPITVGVLISAFETVSGCFTTEFIDIPNCDCPEIDPPTGENVSICIDEQPIVLSVNVPTDMTANWFLEQGANTPFLENSTTFTLQDSAAGVYSFFVETYDPATDCSSNLKLRLDVEINGLPEVVDSSIIICDIEDDGTETVNLQSYNNLISTNPANTFTYFLTRMDAELDQNPLPDDFTVALGDTILFVKVTNVANCSSIAELTLILNDLPIANVGFDTFLCKFENPATIEAEPFDVDGTMLTSLDGINFDETTIYTDLEFGVYDVYIQDENGCINVYNLDIPEGLDIFVTTFTAECNDNGTTSDASDDFYTVTVLIENNKDNEGTFDINFDGTTQFTYNYGETESFTIPADENSTLTITIFDNDFFCTEEQTIGPLNPCSTNCDITIDFLDIMCMDNGTGTDPSDDFNVVTINASALNGASNNTYNVFIEGILLYNFTYGMDETFEVGADGGNINITLQDNEDIQCQLSQEIGPLGACSDGCQILLDVVSVECSNNGTATVQDDDFYTYTINGTILNGALTQFELFVDGISQGLFDYNDDVVFDIAADGLTHSILVVDVDNPGCEDTFETEALENCSTDCEILLNEMIEEECFDNETPEDPSDDFYVITFNASAVNGAANQLFNVYVNDVFVDDFPYDMDNELTIPAGGSVSTIRFQDSEELACELEFETGALTPCSDGCLIELSIQTAECFDNNTATNINDDFYEFTLVGTLLNGATNTEYELFIDGESDGVYSYDELVNITLNADNLTHILRIIDTSDPACTFEVETETLLSCSTDCEIVAQDILYACFDNGTPTDPSDDFYELTVNASAINGATTNAYNLYINDVLEGIFTYETNQVVTVPASQDETVTLRFQDSQDLQCELEVETQPLNPCSDGCLIDINIISVTCFDNDTPTNVNDDFYQITIAGEILNGMSSNSFEIFVDGAADGGGDYGIEYILTIPADGATHEIILVDSNDENCIVSYTTDLLTSCSTDCEITISDLIFACMDNGTLDDPSDDFYEVSFTASAINGGTGYTLSVSGSTVGNYNYNQLVQLSFPADGSALIFVLADLSDNQCFFNQVVVDLDPCSDLCTIEPTILDGVCMDNGTPIDPSDDFWEITIIVEPINGVLSDEFELSIDGMVDGLYPYSQNIIITIPADNGTHFIEVSDSMDPDCDASLTTEVLTSCSTPCEISATYDNVVCQNNGTNDTSDDDIFFVDLTVSNPSPGSFEIPELMLVGAYNSVITIGPFDITTNNVFIEIVDQAQNLCFIELELVPPPTCSECEQTVDAGAGGMISCEVSEVALLGSASEEGMYIWLGPAGNLVSEDIDAIATSVGTYTFRVTFEDGCIAEDQVEVVADTDLPAALATSNGGIDCEKLTSILDASPSGSANQFIFYWFDEAGNLLSQEQIFEVDEPGVYFLQVESLENNCLSAVQPIVVEDLTNEPSAVIYAEPSNVIDCVIETIVLSTDQEENVNYIWTVNGEQVESSLELEISEIGTYGLLAVDTITGCTGNADLVISSLVDYPAINLESLDQLDCENEEVLLVASTIHSGNNLTSFWQDENLTTILENQDTLLVTEPGAYSYTLIDNDNGCENTESIDIELFTNEVEIFTEPEITYIDGTSVLLSATVNLNSSEIESINWTPSENMSCSTCLSTRITEPTDSLYTITVIDIYGCQDTAQVRLIKKNRPEVYVPNVINPNSTSGNNMLVIYGNEEVDEILQILVYDRWGNKMYFAENLAINDPSNGWDGTYNGTPVEQGVYVYFLEVLLLDGTMERFHGDITILR